MKYKLHLKVFHDTYGQPFKSQIFIDLDNITNMMITEYGCNLSRTQIQSAYSSLHLITQCLDPNLNVDIFKMCFKGSKQIWLSAEYREVNTQRGQQIWYTTEMKHTCFLCSSIIKRLTVRTQWYHSAPQRQTQVSAYLESKQIILFVFAIVGVTVMKFK